MTFGSILYSFFLMPIQIVFELVYSSAYKATDGMAVLAIVALSLTINILVLPLYKRADAMQEEERQMEKKLHPVISHIKKTFRGDERTMMLQAYYRQNNYSPLHVLKSAVSLFLEIPFFIAAYNFLSGLTLLNGVTFGPIADLSKPDELIKVFGLSINFLPILMTLINVISTVIFTKDYPLKSKIQLYGMAAFFLVFLYNSPSGLVFYWTLNNIFSLVKTIFYKLKNPKKVLSVVLLISAGGFAALGVYLYNRTHYSSVITFSIIISVALCIPFIFGIIKKHFNIKPLSIKAEPNKKMFFIGTAFLVILTGLLIPSSVIAASPQEFILIGIISNPVWYVVSSFFTAAGMFFLWLGIFYWLFSKKAKVIIERAVFAFCAIGVINYAFFGNNRGTISPDLVYDQSFLHEPGAELLNMLLLIAVCLIIVFILIKKAKIIRGIILASTFAMLCLSVVNVVGIYRSVAQVDFESIVSSKDEVKLTLSKNEKNVVVLMLDRAMGEYVPYIMNEHPELTEQFSGFTYYSNTISYGGHTNFGSPALFGGYEYTPVELNKRDTELLKDKHNEALKVMPAIFDAYGYDVTVCDPPYAGYQEMPDLGIYDDYPDIKTYITEGIVVSDDYDEKLFSEIRCRSFFSYSFMRICPVFLQKPLYDEGRYHTLEASYNPTFRKSYDVLKKLPSITKISDNDAGSFIMMENNATHNQVTFGDPEYMQLSNDAVKRTDDELTLNGVTLDLSNKKYMASYQTNIAAFKRLGEWFDYLREQGVYDNTRIILVADHGHGTMQIENLLIDETAYAKDDENNRFGDVEFYFPLLMVKDFGATGFTTSTEFMSNADVPTLATKDIIESPTNPFTGKAITSDEKTAHKQYILASNHWYIFSNNGNQFRSARWYSIHDDIWKKENWQLESADSIMPY